MRIVGIDFGEKRIGVAAADDRLRIAIPVATVDASGDPLEAIIRIAAEERADMLVVGLPLSLTGAEGPQALAVRQAVKDLESRLSIPVHLQDERLTTRQASHADPAKKKSVSREKAGAPTRDSAAAAILLQAWLDSQRPYG
jgi:putative Holliday junction resolvase